MWQKVLDKEYTAMFESQIYAAIVKKKKYILALLFSVKEETEDQNFRFDRFEILILFEKNFQ